MDFFKWEDSYSVGVRKIDEQHKKLFDLINQLGNAMITGKGRDIISKLLKELKDYTVYHFTDEEKLMEDNGYPELLSHKDIHKNFVNKIKDFEKKNEEGNLSLSVDLFNFLKDWLKGHILGTDMKYKEFFKSKGIE